MAQACPLEKRSRSRSAQSGALRVEPQVVEVERRQDFRCGKRAADVPGLRGVDHVEHVDAVTLGLQG